jgi:putative ABC transport system substrate-binding protein
MTIRIERRRFLAALGGAIVAWPHAAPAQQADRLYRVGVLGSDRSLAVTAAGLEAFVAQLRQRGFVEGRNLVLDYRDFSQGLPAPELAADLVRSKVDAIVTSGPEATLQPVVAATRSIPIVMMAINFDPIARGYVASLSHPGGNVTGLVYRQTELAPKQVELLTQGFPQKKRLAVLWDEYSADQFRAAELAAKSLQLEVIALKLEHPPYDFAAAFGTLVAAHAEMVLLLSISFFSSQRKRIAELAIVHRLPTMFIFKTYVAVGGLMSYGAEILPIWRGAADYVAKILNGAKPADLPVEQATRLDLVINLKTAKAIGVELPTAILLRADEVIE